MFNAILDSFSNYALQRANYKDNIIHMGGIKRFKSFEEAGRYTMEELYRQPLDVDRMERFFKELSGWIGNPYKPGVYRFGSFEEADKYDRQQYIKQAIKKAS